MLTENTLRRLEARQQELAELFLDQSDPDEWRDLSNAALRGDTYWLKKNANQTLGIMVRIQSLINAHARGGSEDEPDGNDELIRKAEQDAIGVIDRVRITRK